MNWAASHVADRKEFCQVIETKRFSKAESGQEKEIISQKKKKKGIVSGKVPSLRRMEGFCGTDNISSAEYLR